MKRTLSLILALLLCLSLLPAAALADEAEAFDAPAYEEEVPAEAEEIFAEAEETSAEAEEVPAEAEEVPAEAEEVPAEAEEVPAEAEEDFTEETWENDEFVDDRDTEVHWTDDEATLALWTDGASLTVSEVRSRLAAVLDKYPSGSSWNTSFNGGIQCYGFGRLVVHEVFGYTSGGYYRSWTYTSAGSGMYTVGRIETCTEENVRELLSRARPGDVLQFAAGPNGHQHTQIIYDVTSTGVVIYENNWSGYNIVSLKSMTFREFAQRQYEGGTIGGAKRRGTLSLFRSDNYDVSDATLGEAELTIYDARYPAGELPEGRPYTLRGLIASGTTISNVSAYIYDANGMAVFSYSRNPASTSYDIETGGIDESFTFGKLPVGTYRYVVKATDGKETKTLIDSSFVIGNPTTYQITYDANGGTYAPEAQTKNHGKNLTLSTDEPIRTGYLFMGWAETSTAEKAMYQPGSVYSRDAGLQLYAVWELDAVVVPSAPIIVIADDNSIATVIGHYDDLYARVALLMDFGGLTGLYVTQVPIAANGLVEIPTVVLPGIEVLAVSIVLVSRLEDISTPTPEAITSIFKYL